MAFTSRLSGVDVQATSVMLLIGLAVGVDYSMFYVKRQREERAAGRPVLDAIETAAATSGRSVLISGLTVLLAMSGMFLTGSKIFYGIGQATMLVVAVAVIGSLTLLPALLALLGDRVDRGRLPFAAPGPAARRPGPGLDRGARPGAGPPGADRGAGGVRAGRARAAGAAPAHRHPRRQRPAAEAPPPCRRTTGSSRCSRRRSPAVVVVEAPDVTSPAVAAAGPALTSRPGQRPDEPADHVHRQPRAHRRDHPGPAGRHRGGRGIDRALATLRDKVIPDTLGRCPAPGSR